MMRFQVRFHLGKGENFGKWQVRYREATYYLDPERVSLNMVNCKLRNQPSAAQKIYAGAHKKVCAWIDCEELEVGHPVHHVGVPVSYNPRVAPHWRGEAGENIDGKRIGLLRSNGRQLVSTGGDA
jgi:hypothetical protein